MRGNFVARLTALAAHQTCRIPEVQSLLPLLQRAHTCLSYQAQDQNISQALQDIHNTLKNNKLPLPQTPRLR
ncbi:hypothetical protein M433DRAFT_10625 [Acidomyces richmondensis BFW]|nr:hypothetical protein M433DRAFT_10625 [Acidomyces richmondensis BFW]